MASPRPDGILRRLRWPLVFIAGVFVTGIIGYLILGFSFVDAFSNTSLVLTTVGFSPRDPLDDADKIFTDVIALLGVTSYLSLLAVGVAAIADGQFGVASRRRRMERRIARLRDHVIVCAYGRVGRAAARELEASGTPFVVLDRDEHLESRMRADGVVYLIEDPTSEDVLLRAGILRARALISAVDSDADSVFITLTARSLGPKLFIVARGGQPLAADRLYRAGADRVISPYVSSGRHMSLLARRPRIVDYLEIRAGDGTPLRLEEIVIEERSPLIGMRLRAVCGPATPLVARRGAGDLLIEPSDDLVLDVGDLVVLLGDPSVLERVEQA